MQLKNLDIKIMATINGASLYNKKEEVINPTTGKKEKRDILDEEFKPIKDRSQGVQLATMFWNEDKGIYEKETIKFKKELSDKEIEQMIGKTFLFTNVEEYEIPNKETRNGKEVIIYSYSYGASEMKEIQNPNKEGKEIFEVLKSTQLEVINVIEKEKIDFKTKAKSLVFEFQIKIVEGFAFSIHNVVVNKNVKTTLQDLKKFVGKKVLFDKLITKMKFSNGSNGFYMETLALPQIQSQPQQAPKA